MVAAYRKPEYEVKITTDHDRYTRGDKVTATLAASYYFGSPVPGAEVKYTIYRTPTWYYPPDEEAPADEGFEEGYEGDQGLGEVAEEGSARTNDAGEAMLRFGTGLAMAGEADDYQYTIEATVTDPSRREVTESKSLLVTRGEFRLLLDPERYVAAPRQPLSVRARAVAYDGKPLAAGLSLQVGLGRTEWTDEGERQTLDEALRTITTDARGEVTFTVTPPEAGDFAAVARAVDARGNHIEETAGIWATSDAEPVRGHGREGVQLVLDKKSYRAGERVTALVTTAETAAALLLTIEGDRLYRHEVVPLKAGSTEVSLPVLEAPCTLR